MSAVGWLMQHGVPARISQSFILLTLGTSLAVYALLLGRLRPSSKGIKAIAVIGVLAAFQAALAKSGFLLDHADFRPPVLLLVLLPSIVLLVWLARSKKALAAIKSFNPVVLIGLQAFRVPVEIILAQLSEHHLIPEVMSWHGRNIDVLTGLSAPVVAWLLYQKKIGARFVRAWNWMGIALVTNVVVHAMLATPAVGLLKTAVPNLLPNFFPFVWLPGILVPIAYALHIASLRSLGRK